MWLGAVRLAKDHKQWIPTFGEFYSFFAKRKDSPYHSEFLNGVLKIQANSQNDNAAISVPRETHSGKFLSKVEVDGIETTKDTVVNAWYEEVLVAVPAGQHLVKIYYS